MALALPLPVTYVECFSFLEGLHNNVFSSGSITITRIQVIQNKMVWVWCFLVKEPYVFIFHLSCLMIVIEIGMKKIICTILLLQVLCFSVVGSNYFIQQENA